MSSDGAGQGSTEQEILWLCQCGIVTSFIAIAGCPNSLSVFIQYILNVAQRVKLFVTPGQWLKFCTPLVLYRLL